MASALLALLGTLAGGGIALAGQSWMSRRERRTRQAELLLEQCARLVSLAEDFRNRVWEEETLALEGRLENWDIAAHRQALAMIRLLSADTELTGAVETLNESGKAYGGYWRRGGRDAAQLQQLRLTDKAALSNFIAVSGGVLRRELER